MKKQLKIITIAILILSLGQIIFGQEKIIESSDFNAINNKAYGLKQKSSYREKRIAETFINKGTELKQKHITISEHLPPDRSYYKYQIDIDGKEFTKEVITIGKKQFSRENDGKWGIYEPDYGIGSGSGGGSSRTIKFIGSEKFGKKNVSIYEVFETTYTSRGDREETSKYWFDENGYLLKQTYQGKSLDKDEVYMNVTTYDYEAIIKIEAPEVEKPPQM